MRSSVEVTEKGGKERNLYLNSPAVCTLRDWLKFREDMADDDRLFTSRKGTGLTREGIYRVLARLAGAAGVRGRFNPHAFRHAFARDTLQAGADLSQVSELLGHNSVAVTAEYYARWDDRELQATHRRVSPGAKIKFKRFKQTGD